MSTRKRARRSPEHLWSWCAASAWVFPSSSLQDRKHSAGQRARHASVGVQTNADAGNTATAWLH
eukprot:3121149-Rhodomonas_salina.4